jgi:5-methyltetrahydrofolate--homocysteine methyltransferase
MRAPLLERVRRGEGILGDGAWGSVLLERGLPPGHAPERWVLERPDEIARLAREYLEAGAEILTTNTFGGSPSRLRLHGLEDQLDAINATAVRIAREVAGRDAYVSASVGPSGVLLAPYGPGDPGAIREGFARQIAALAAAGADLICIETMTDVAEAEIAVRAAREAAPGLPVIATMTFDLTPRGAFTVMGTRVAEAATRLEAAGASVVGANCGAGVDAMIAVAREFSAATTLPIAVRPNAGLPQRRDGRLVYLDTPDRFADAAAALLTAGVSIVGGCCGTAPAYIAALARRLGQPRPAAS